MSPSRLNLVVKSHHHRFDDTIVVFCEHNMNDETVAQWSIRSCVPTNLSLLRKYVIIQATIKGIIHQSSFSGVLVLEIYLYYYYPTFQPGLQFTGLSGSPPEVKIQTFWIGPFPRTFDLGVPTGRRSRGFLLKKWWFLDTAILLMEEIPNNHLGCMKPCK